MNEKMYGVISSTPPAELSLGGFKVNTSVTVYFNTEAEALAYASTVSGSVVYPKE